MALRRRITPAEIARTFGVSHDKVLGWIHSGELRAVNVATRVGGKKPRFVIDPSDLEEFERRRLAVQPQEDRAPRRRHATREDVEEFC